MMAPGGVAIAGFPARVAYPAKLQPTNPLVMWSYTDLSDERLTLTQKYLILRQDPANVTPQKIGLFHEDTWGCYFLNEDVFFKRTRGIPGEQYADLGCSLEMFTNNEFLELETLGPLRRILPGQSVEHTECWTLHRKIRLPEFVDDDIDHALPSILESAGLC